MSINIIKALECFEELVENNDKIKIMLKDKTEVFVEFWTALEENAVVNITDPEEMQEVVSLMVAKDYLQDVKSDQELAMLFT
ncbi:MAG: hypothetical protein ACTSO3_16685 [Candidatus Heimdallarchaeaceae archaeon]